MLYRISSLVLSICGGLALVLGLLFWTGNGYALISIHMLLGLLTVLALWVIGVAQAVRKDGTWTVAIIAIVFGLFVLWFGMVQTSLLPGDLHWIIKVVHLLVGVATIGFGQSVASRARRTAA